MLLESLLTKLAAAGLATKAAAGGAAVVVAASAAGAADVLPAPAQDAFDRMVAEEVADDEGAAPTEAEGTFGDRVSEDARDGGVDGREIACEASEGRSRACEDTDVDEPVDDDEAGMEGFGERVAEDARDGGVDGQEVSQEARERNPGRAGAKPADVSDVPAPTGDAD